jgi:cellulose synthase/poly-beta-1,6-N-acetylglucosamine synthase-like glycosyltransferase
MLTEDIDSSIRALERGARIASDPGLISEELAPTSARALVNQRLRWAQGWFQVSRRRLRKALVSRRTSLRQKSGLVFLLGWREVYPWLSLQVFPYLAYVLLHPHSGGSHGLRWGVPLFLLSSVVTMSVGPAQVAFAYALADPSVRRNSSWFLVYLLVASVFYTEAKNVIGRVAQLKEVMGERQWKVTARPVPAAETVEEAA